MNTIVFEKPFTHLTVIIKKARIYIDKCQPAITLTQICYQAIGFVQLVPPILLWKNPG